MGMIVRFFRAERGALGGWLERKFTRLLPMEMRTFTLEQTWDRGLEKDKR